MFCCSRLVDMDQAEWLELVQLELPSILGVAAPGAEVLDVSEPTFWTQEDTEEESDFTNDTSMGLYSPSPRRSVVDETPGFNLQPPSGFAQLQDEPSHAGEQLARAGSGTLRCSGLLNFYHPAFGISRRGMRQRLVGHVCSIPGRMSGETRQASC